MTVIAIRDGVVAADSEVNCTGYQISYGEIDKIYEHRGWIFGAAGSVSACQQFARWMKGSRIRPDWQAFHGIVLRPDGRVFEFDSSHVPIEIRTHYGAAIGSGQNTAIAAMMAGASAIEAVEITAKLDHECGGPVKVLSLNSNPKFQASFSSIRSPKRESLRRCPV